ncbi:MAG TPA: hypothetical protein VN581_07035 [Patescibacteria group bacterium]|nr:hypothetical protein [Patescibacteria group bacterium]
MRLSPALTVAFCTLLAACGIAVPDEKRDYVGEWRAVDMSLRITRDGRVEYWRSQGLSKTTVEGPLQSFDGDDFTVGVSVMTTTFDVTIPPHEADREWTMTVDGVRLKRVLP